MARLQILSAAILFGTTGTAQTLAPEIEPLVVGASRIAVGATLLLLVALLVGRMRVGRGRLAVVLGGACVALYQATFFAAVAETGVDYISVGALTHSAPALDVSLLLDPLE